LLNNAGVISVRQNNIPAYAILAKPSKKTLPVKIMDDFAVAIDNIPKIVFQIRLRHRMGKCNAINRTIDEVVLELKQQSGQPFLLEVGV